MLLVLLLTVWLLLMLLTDGRLLRFLFLLRLLSLFLLTLLVRRLLLLKIPLLLLARRLRLLAPLLILLLRRLVCPILMLPEPIGMTSFHPIWILVCTTIVRNAIRAAGHSRHHGRASVG